MSLPVPVIPAGRRGGIGPRGRYGAVAAPGVMDPAGGGTAVPRLRRICINTDMDPPLATAAADMGRAGKQPGFEQDQHSIRGQKPCDPGSDSRALTGSEGAHPPP